jgi:small subunit ribosomal protein S18
VAKKRKPMRVKPIDKGKGRKIKVSPLVKDSVPYVDYKDVNLLRTFMSERAKIRARRVNGNDAQQQREVARAIKNAREMALLPYANRVVTQRRGDKKRPGRPEGPGAPPGPPPGDRPQVGDRAPAPPLADVGADE